MKSTVAASILLRSVHRYAGKARPSWLPVEGPESSRSIARSRFLSSTSSIANLNEPVFENFVPSPPEELTTEMAEGITDATQFYIRYGVSNRRLQDLAKERNMSVVLKWQKMMEIYLTTQVHVIAGLGYSPNEEGLTKFAHDLAYCITQADDTMKELFTEVRRDTWREIVATAFSLNVKDIPVISIAEARNIMHKISSKMIQPDVLLKIQQETSQIQGKPFQKATFCYSPRSPILSQFVNSLESDGELEIAMKHQVLQNVVVNTVYLGGNPSLLEEVGFGSGPEGYAKLQCAMTDHEGDPLIGQYAASALIKMWSAAGLDIASIQGPGLGPNVVP